MVAEDLSFNITWPIIWLEVLKLKLLTTAALIVEIESGNLENDKLVKDIEELKTALLAVMSP